MMKTWCKISSLADQRRTPKPFLNLAVISEKIVLDSTGMENGANDSKDPSGFLSEIIGAPVTVKLNSSVVYRGKAPGYDDAEELDSRIRMTQVSCLVWMDT